MTYLHYNELITLLGENNVYENTFEVYKEASLEESLDASIVIAASECGEAFHIEITYPFKDDPLIQFKELDITLPDEFDLIEIELTETCMFEIDSSVENVEEYIALFVSSILDILYGKPNENLHYKIHKNSNGFYDFELHNKFSNALISVQTEIFCDRDFCLELKKVSDSKEFIELYSLQTKIARIDRKKNKDNICNKVFIKQKSQQKLPLLKAYFYAYCNLYKLYENILSMYVDEIDDFSEWVYKPVKLHFDCWEIDDYRQMTASYRETFGKPNGFEYLDIRLLDLKRVLNIVTDYPGIERAEIYQRLGLNGRTYGGIISSVLVANNLIVEEQLKSKRLLYPLCK